MISVLANTTSPIFSPDRNFIVQALLKFTIYKQFCAGRKSSEILIFNKNLRSIGYSGVILSYAKETLFKKNDSRLVSSGALIGESICEEVTNWTKGILTTIDMVESDDFVALKLSGVGYHATNLLAIGSPASPILSKAIDSICDAAVRHNVRLLFDAEQAALQKGVNRWSLHWMAKYNKNGNQRALIYGTYQAYLKSTPSVLSSHLQAALDDNFTLGVKLVRGAYLQSDPRSLIHDTKADTDYAFDGIAAGLVCQEYEMFWSRRGSDELLPSVNIMLATHNSTSIRKILALQKALLERGKISANVVYAQLQGMADDVSCELIAEKYQTTSDAKHIAKVYKYLVWGTVGECMKYLLRRAHENREAIERTKVVRNAMWWEIVRRLRQGRSVLRAKPGM